MFNDDAIVIEDPQIGRMFKDPNNTNHSDHSGADFNQLTDPNPEINGAKGMLISNRKMLNFSSIPIPKVL